MSGKTIICILGLPGSGKTTLADKLAIRFDACRINADYVRNYINTDLGFSAQDRIEQARRMGYLANLVLNTGRNDCAIVDFVCPTMETREAFITACGHPIKFIWMNTIKPEQSRFANTSALWVPPTEINCLEVTDWLATDDISLDAIIPFV